MQDYIPIVLPAGREYIEIRMPQTTGINGGLFFAWWSMYKIFIFCHGYTDFAANNVGKDKI